MSVKNNNRGIYKMKTIIRNFQKTIVLFLKLFTFAMLFFCFFGLMGIPNWQLWNLSRTAGITMLTFAAVEWGMLTAYGTYDIGKKKSKPIIYSMSLGVVITDLVTYVELTIMNTNQANNVEFRFENIGLLILVVILQIFVIIGMTYLGNYIYFRINRPEISCIITGSQVSLEQLYHGVDKYKKQYRVDYIVDYHSPEVKSIIIKCDTVFMYDVPVDLRKELIEFCYRHMRNVYFNPEISDIVEFMGDHVVLDDVSLLSAPVKELSMEQKIIKRLMDIVGSLLVLIITSPLFLISAIAIKCNDKGPVFFKQKRATKDGRIFEIYKFRTMRVQSENYSVTSDDDRITSVGKILRRYRIDELPQMINILKGEMSLVGPRPEMLYNIFDYTKTLPEFSYRLRVKAGLTGYAQIAGKYNTSPRDKLILDLIYIERYSIWKDIKLLLQTLIVLFKKDSTEAFGKKYSVMFEENGVVKLRNTTHKKDDN